MNTVDDIKDRVWRHYRACNLPRKFDDFTMTDLKIIGESKKERDHNKGQLILLHEYYNNIRTNLLNGTGLVICGPVGVGKTLMTIMIAHEVLNIFDKENMDMTIHGRTISNDGTKYDEFKNKLYFIQATSLARLALPGLSEEEQKMRPKLKYLSGLCIDDIAKMQESKSQFEMAYLDDILRYRDLNALPTWITCQLPFKELESVLGKPIFDLLRANNLVLELIADSQR